MGYTLRDDQYWPTGDVVPGHSSWRSQREHAGGGALLEHSIHSADILTWLFGPAAHVYARTPQRVRLRRRGHRGLHDRARLGRRRHVDLDLQRRARPRGTPARGVLRAGRGRGDHRLPRRRTRGQLPRSSGPIRNPNGSTSPRCATGTSPPTASTAATSSSTSIPAARAFVRSVREKQPAAPTFSDALAAHALVDAAYRSVDRQLGRRRSTCGASS